MNDVVEEAKRMISRNPNAPFVVKELKAYSNAKVSFIMLQKENSARGGKSTF